MTMSKTIGVLIALVLLGTTSVLAVADVPTQKVSVEPIEVTAGSDITISAFLYNNQKETITFTLLAKGGDTTIGKPVVTLAAGSAKTVTIGWKQPKTQTTVTVSVVSALNSKKVDITSLHGSLGAVLVGPVLAPTPNTPLSSPKGTVTKLYQNSKLFLEEFRVKQMNHFARERDEARAEVNQTTVATLPGAPVDDGIEVAKVNNPMDYGMLVLSTALASFFASVAMFYGALFLIVFLIIRLFFKLFI